MPRLGSPPLTNAKPFRRASIAPDGGSRHVTARDASNYDPILLVKVGNTIGRMLFKPIGTEAIGSSPGAVGCRRGAL